jgi:hypothetical protein
MYRLAVAARFDDSIGAQTGQLLRNRGLARAGHDLDFAHRFFPVG